MSDIEAADDAHAGLRAVVTGGGTPTPEQAAALAAALLTVQAEPQTSDTGLSGWQRAALIEGTGARRHAERADLDRPAVMR